MGETYKATLPPPNVPFIGATLGRWRALLLIVRLANHAMKAGHTVSMNCEPRDNVIEGHFGDSR